MKLSFLFFENLKREILSSELESKKNQKYETYLAQGYEEALIAVFEMEIEEVKVFLKAIVCVIEKADEEKWRVSEIFVEESSESVTITKEIRKEIEEIMSTKTYADYKKSKKGENLFHGYDWGYDEDEMEEVEYEEENEEYLEIEKKIMESEKEREEWLENYLKNYFSNK